MARLSVAVMAHPRRIDLVERLVERLDVDTDLVAWDQRNSVWDTARRAWLAYDPEATHHLVVQDDAVVCRDLVAGLEKALDHVPAAAFVSLYCGTRRPGSTSIARLAAAAAAADASWLVMPGVNWGVALIAPTVVVADMVTWCDTLPYPQDDRRISRYARTLLGWDTWHTWPSLVDHSGARSLLGHARGRSAYQFAGEDVSALHLPFDGPVVRPPEPDRTAAPRRRPARRHKETQMADQEHTFHDPEARRDRIASYVERRGARLRGEPQADQQATMQAYELAERRRLHRTDAADAGEAPEPAAEPAEAAPAGPTDTAGTDGDGDTDTTAQAESDAPEPPPESGKGSTVAAWRTYMKRLGVPDDEVKGKTKAQLVKMHEALASGEAASREQRRKAE